MLKTSFVATRALFRVLCSGVSVSVFGLCVKLVETMLQLVVLVVAITVGPGCERLVRFVILVIGFLRAWRILCISIVYLGLSTVVGTVGRIGRYCYCYHCCSVEILDILEYFVTTGFLDCVFHHLHWLFCNFLNLRCHLFHNSYYQDDYCD